MIVRLQVAWLISMVPSYCAETRAISQELELEDRECVIDDDCGLAPYFVCCTECPPAPPFRAVPRSAIDAMLIEAETACAERTISCPEVTCDRPAPGCDARARCDHGRCVVQATGCERPTS